MHVISRKKLREFWGEHPDSETPLGDWYKVAKKAEWERFADIRAIYGSADVVGKFVVFNVGGNEYRLIAEVFHEGRVVLIRHVLTHGDYDRGKWKS